MLNRRPESDNMDPKLGSLVLAELVLSIIDELETLGPDTRTRLYARAIKKAREADHDRVPEVVATLEAMRQGKIGT